MSDGRAAYQSPEGPQIFVGTDIAALRLIGQDDEGWPDNAVPGAFIALCLSVLIWMALLYGIWGA
ncbi:hypothetical protein M2336_003637 [Sphingobium sp. B1D7B]|uniref:hypothetical protein n=1 Tax=Sphingobium sp. B1D7B TaxID=2940578 RepID=UPI0022243222|nr:hypothetical protein [Sphingobium sp. B1D7B]MCW2406953.1 hypothetical protein [Sphingobium sp. B1D7B]